MFLQLRQVLIFITLFSSSLVQAQVTISASAAAAKSNLSSQFGASYEQALPNSPISLSFALDSSSYRSKVTYVDVVGESTITGSEYSATFGIGLFEKVYIDFRTSSGSVNNSTVLISEFGFSPRFRFGDFNFGLGLETQNLKQNKSYNILSRDFQSELAFKKTTHKVRLGYQFTDDFGMNVSHAKMSYDKDMESALQILINPTLATNNGVDMLSQINGLLQSVTEINLNYLISEKLELEFSIGRTQDFYDPKTVANDVRLGVLVYQTSSFNWGLGLTSGKSEVDTERSNSLDTILLYAF